MSANPSIHCPEFFLKNTSDKFPLFLFTSTVTMLIANQACSPIGTVMHICQGPYRVCEARQVGMTTLGSKSEGVLSKYVCLCIYVCMNLWLCLCVCPYWSPCIPAEMSLVRCRHIVSCHSHSAAAVLWMASSCIQIPWNLSDLTYSRRKVWKGQQTKDSCQNRHLHISPTATDCRY